MFELKQRDVAIILAHSEPRMCTEMYSSPQFCEVICASQLVLFSVRRSSPEAGGRDHYTAFFEPSDVITITPVLPRFIILDLSFLFYIKKNLQLLQISTYCASACVLKKRLYCVSTIITVYYSASI